MRSLTTLRLVALVALVALAACGDDDGGAGTPDAGAADPGALIAVTLDSKVGVLLDDLPAGALRERAAAATLAQPDEFWLARARTQIGATRMRLIYRRWLGLADGKLVGQLPLPPPETWQVTLAPAGALRETIDGHDLVTIEYGLRATLLSDIASVAFAEEALFTPGGSWDEPFVLPVDPELVFQRTGYACLRESSEDGTNAVDGENALLFFDHTCAADEPLAAKNCHVNVPSWPTDCQTALHDDIGAIAVDLHYERLPWDAALADSVRVVAAPPPVADLAVLAEGLDRHRLVYRYFAADSCAVAEGCVGGAGWRRLLMFDASVKNVGGAPVELGSPTDAANAGHHIFEYSECHGHEHFRFYGDFALGDATGDKRAFCLLSTGRYANNEQSPLATDYDSCTYQGIAAGWGDDYYAGLDCQWIDVTGVDTSGGAVTRALEFTSNPDGFLCEGTPVRDAAGKLTFEPSGYLTDDGQSIDRPVCDFAADHDANNRAARDVVLPVRGGYVTAPCTRGQLSPLRDCGLAEQPGAITCQAGAQAQLSCTQPDAAHPQLLRVCEHSTTLGGGVACEHASALAVGIVEGAPVTVGFTCPLPRDAAELGGKVAVYASPAIDGDPAATVTCTLVN